MSSSKNLHHVFTVGRSLRFAAQIPDDSVGCSGSRCSNCHNAVAYANHLCPVCTLPFVGPFGFPQIGDWQALTFREQRMLVEDIFSSHANRGRIVYSGVPSVPLDPDEVGQFAKLGWEANDRFKQAHGITPEVFLRKHTPVAA